MAENLPKEKTSRKPGRTNAPKIPVLDSYDIIGHTFLMPPQYDGQSFRFLIIKITCDHLKK